MCTIQAQSLSPTVLSTAGNAIQGNAMQIDWTISELAISTIQNTEQQITEGFHQPFYLLESVENLPNEIGEINIHPNPTVDMLKISMTFPQRESVTIRLFNVAGQLIRETEKHGSQLEEMLSLGKLATRNYLLQFLLQERQNIHAFTIQKIH